jgi:hypothetical protein
LVKNSERRAKDNEIARLKKEKQELERRQRNGGDDTPLPSSEPRKRTFIGGKEFIDNEDVIPPNYW